MTAFFETNCLSLMAEHCPFGMSGPKHPGRDCFPADQRNAAWPLRAAACRRAAISNGTSAPHLHGRRPGALQSSPPHYGKEGGGRWSSAMCASFLLRALEKHQPPNASPFRPLAIIHTSPPLCPGFICHYSPPQSIQAPTPKKCIKCQFKGIRHRI